MVGDVLAPLVVVATDVERSKTGGGLGPFLAVVVPEIAEGRGDGTRGIEPADDRDHLFAEGDTGGIGAFGDFVADTPKDHAGMIAVAPDHGFEIAFPPVLEIEVVVVGILGFFPHVEGLIDDEDAEAIAGIEKGGRRRIVAGADRVEAVGLHELDAAFFGAVNGGGTERTVVMMHAAAFEFDPLAVELKAFGDREPEGADAEGGRGAVDDPLILQQLDFGAIESGVLEGPKNGMVHQKRLVEFLLLAGGDADVAFLRPGSFTVGSDKAGLQPDGNLGAAAIIRWWWIH